MLLYSFIFQLGYVAFVLGGSLLDVELYSSEGKCQHKLASLPSISISFNDPVMVLINNQVLACGGSNSYTCVVYDIKSDSWNFLTSASKIYHGNYPGSIYQGNIYLTHDQYPEVFEPSSNLWSLWPVAPASSGMFGCMVTWKDSFLYFGGDPDENTISKYSHETKSWTTLPFSSPPILIRLSACIVLPNQNILVAGAVGSTQNFRRYAIYNVTSNNWPIWVNGFADRSHSTAVFLGERVFIFSGSYVNNIEEYHYDKNNIVTTSRFQLLTSRATKPGVLSLPAYLFSHLPGGCVGVM